MAEKPDRSVDIVKARRVMRKMPALLRALLVDAEVLRMLSDLQFRLSGFQQQMAEQVKDQAAASASQARAVETWTESGDTMAAVWDEIRSRAQSQLREALGSEVLGLLGIEGAEDV